MDIQSEQYSALGSLAAEGFKKLLGTPSTSLLQTLIRESIQNSCDAVRSGLNASIMIRIRRFDEEQMSFLRNKVFNELPGSEVSENLLAEFLNKERPWAVEIADFNSSGLGGTTRVDQISAEDNSTDFIDFFRNVGSRRDTERGGGTYGYGKSSLYLSSSISTILVDTQTEYAGEASRRFMACHLGDAYEVRTENRKIRKMTGRHWWGAGHADDVVDPVEGEEANYIAQMLGFPLRNKDTFGTSILIPDPVFLNERSSAEEVIAKVAETVLWYFWPRLTETTAPSKKIEIRLELDGKEYLLPRPEDFPPLDLFSEAIKKIRNNEGESVQTIRTERPSKEVGKLVVKKGVHGERVQLLPEKSKIPKVSHHIAVMRPVELVVRYYEGEALPDSRVEWAGVFICDDDTEVESAFASAEPPAHDDWQPSLLSGSDKTYVRKAIISIKEACKSVAQPVQIQKHSGGDGPSLAYVASKFGQVLHNTKPSTAGQKRRKKGGGGRANKSPYTQPTFLRLITEGRAVIAVFETTISDNGIRENLELVAEPSISLDGGGETKSDSGILMPEVYCWQTRNGDFLSRKDRISLNSIRGEIQIHVLLRGDYAVSLKLFTAKTEDMQNE